MKKRLFAALLASLLILLCLPARAGAADESKLQIVTTIFPPYDFARQIAGEAASVRALLSPGAEAHTYEPTPADIMAIQQSDMFLYIGGESEAWADRILSGLDTSRMRIVRLMDCVDLMKEDGHDDHDHDDFDEHIWTSMPGAIQMLDAILRALCDAAPAKANAFLANADAYRVKLLTLDAAFREAVAGGARDTLAFGDRFALRYFAHEYGLTVHAAFPGCSTEMEPSTATIFELIWLIETEEIPVVFAAEFSNQKVAQVIAEETGARIMTFHSAHNVSKEDYEAGVSFADVMSQNLENLKTALN